MRLSICDFDLFFPSESYTDQSNALLVMSVSRHDVLFLVQTTESTDSSCSYL
uniref:Uncharacterized protein n=1 Tax=Setaria italica TaxID=4555 RepID=K3Z190_SETIT